MRCKRIPWARARSRTPEPVRHLEVTAGAAILEGIETQLSVLLGKV
jgi:hypothetical protein